MPNWGGGSTGGGSVDGYGGDDRDSGGNGGRSTRGKADVEDKGFSTTGQRDNHSSVSSGGRGRNGYGAGSRSQQQAADLAESQERGDLDRARAELDQLLAEEYDRLGLAGIPDQSRESIVGDHDLARSLASRASRVDRRSFSDDIANRTSNGLIGSIANFAGPAGSLVNGAIDAKQAYDFTKNTTGQAPSVSDTLRTGLISAGKSAASSLIAGKVGGVVANTLGRAIDPYAGAVTGLIASKYTGDMVNGVDFNQPGKAHERSLDGPESSQPATQAATPTAPASEPVATAGYNSTFGNYDSHLNNFAYNSNSAFAAWE